MASLFVLFGCRGLQNAIAEGETRTISMHHVHTGENITITYKREGRYDEAALEKLNWFLRDWRRGKQTRMDPKLIDLLWEVQRETGSKEPIDVVCGYRSPETNALLRRASSGVARFSQHILGHAVDFYIPGVPLAELRVIGLRLQRGGVGFYPTSGSPFVHMDTGGVRMWPRMTRDQLLHVFPDGRTVYLPNDGRPLSGYALALADLRRRGQNPTETWIEEARNQGLGKNIVLASGRERLADPDREEDAQEAAATAPSLSPTRSQSALLAALERLAERKRQEAGLTAAAAAGAATYQLASYTIPADGSSTDEGAGLTPRQIVAARGYWDRLPGAGAETQNAAATRAAAARRDFVTSLASATLPNATGAIDRPADAAQERAPADKALAYAQGEARALGASAANLNERTANGSSSATTIAAKRADDRPASTIVAARPRLAATAVAGARYDDPWLDAVLISPNVRDGLTSLPLGTLDYRALAALVDKPDAAVLMTFGADPNPGLTADRFSGSAIVFVSTITYRPSTHTASLH